MAEVKALELGASKQAHHLRFGARFDALCSRLDTEPAGQGDDRVDDCHAFTLAGGRRADERLVDLDLGKMRTGQIAEG